jgi:ribosomal protein L11 methylase PrmA
MAIATLRSCKMKIREGGMPAEELWDSFFDPETILMELGLNGECNNVVDLGCGYGTFTLVAARIARGVVYAFDIDETMIAECKRKVSEAGVGKVMCEQRDFISNGTGLPDQSAD